MKIENKIILISAILSLSFCSPPSGTTPTAAAAIGTGNENTVTRKSVETLPPGSDFAVSVPSTASVPESITSIGVVPVPIINANVPVNANNELAPPGLAPKEEADANPISITHNNSTPPVLPPPVEQPSQPVQSTSEAQATEEPQNFIDFVFSPAPAPLTVPLIESTPVQNQSDIASQIIVPDSILIPETIVITPEVALEIIEAVQTIQPSEPVVVATEPSISSSLAILVGATEPVATSTSITASEPVATSTTTSEITTMAVVETSTSTSVAVEPVSTSSSTSTSTATTTSTATATSTTSSTSTSTVTTVVPNWQSEITSDIAEKELNSTRCAGYSLSLDTTDGVWYTTRTSGSISGIETYWARQSLWVNFRGVCKRGYYRVTVMAKNTDGNLPSSYTNFEVTARNATLGFGYKNKKVSGLIEIAADEVNYHQASTRIWLEPGDNKVELKWMNDYYVPFLYDANIQIKKVWLEPVVTTETQSLTRNGIQYCDIAPNGSEWKWYWKDDYIHTYWANQWADYCFEDLKAVRYKVSITARNYGTLPLPSGYTLWKLKVFAGSNEVIFTVPASKDFKTGYSYIQVPTGVKKLRVLWLNDSYSAGVSDANIQIKNLVLEEAP